MSLQFLRVLAQRRPAQAITAEAPERAELERIVSAAVGPAVPGTRPAWRLIGTRREDAPQLAAALSGFKNLPDLKETTPRLKGKQMRRVAAFRGSLAFASNGGLALALIFRPRRGSGLPRRLQRGEALGARVVLEAAFYASGWATQWSPRKSPDAELLARFYRLKSEEEVLGWLFVGRPAPEFAGDHAATLPPSSRGCR